MRCSARRLPSRSLFFSLLTPLIVVAFLLGLGPARRSQHHVAGAPARARRTRGRGARLRSMIANSSAVVLPLVFGAFGSVLGAAAMFWSMALIAGSGAGAAVRWGKHKSIKAVIAGRT